MYAAPRYFAVRYFGGIWPEQIVAGYRPAAANLVLSTVAPTVARSANIWLTPPAVTLVLSSANVVIRYGTFRIPPSADILLSTLSPDIDLTVGYHIAVPATAQLTISVTPPTVILPPPWGYPWRHKETASGRIAPVIELEGNPLI